MWKIPPWKLEKLSENDEDVDLWIERVRVVLELQAENADNKKRRIILTGA